MSEKATDFINRLIGFSIGPVISAVIGFLTVPITTWLVAPEDFGRASMFTLFHSLMGFVVYLGLDQAFVRDYYKSENKKDLLKYCFLPPFFFSLILVFLLMLNLNWFSNILFGEMYLLPVLLILVSFPFLIIDRFNFLIIRMEEKAKLYSLLTILKRILNAFLLIGIVFFFRNFQGIIAAGSISIIIMTIFLFCLNFDYWKFQSSFTWDTFKPLLRFGLPLVPITLLGWLMNGMDKVALRIWSDFGEIGLYSVAFRIATVFLLFQQAFCTFWAPTSYRWFENGVSLEKYEKVSEYISTILSILAILIILSRKWIVLIFSSEYSSASVLIPFLILYPILYTISETTMMGINFMRRTELGIWVTGAAALFNLGGNWLLVPRFGALGAAVATAVSYVIFFWTRTLISRQIWETFKIKVHIQNISLVILASTLTLIEYKVGSPFVVIIQIIILILIMFLNSKIVSEIFNLSKQIVLSYFRKAK